LQGVELPSEEDDWQPRRFDEHGDPITFEEQLAEQATDVLRVASSARTRRSKRGAPRPTAAIGATGGSAC